MSVRWEFASAGELSLELWTAALTNEETEEELPDGTLTLVLGYDECFAIAGTREELVKLSQRIAEVVAGEAEDVEEDDERECANCGDTVQTLSSRDWCDGCEAGL